MTSLDAIDDVTEDGLQHGTNIRTHWVHLIVDTLGNMFEASVAHLTKHFVTEGKISRLYFPQLWILHVTIEFQAKPNLKKRKSSFSSGLISHLNILFDVLDNNDVMLKLGIT